MEYILNELSLNGQYPGIEEFYTSGLSHINNILNEIRISNALLLKKSDFYGREVMPGVQLYQILYNEGARINDSIRRMKVTLGRCRNVLIGMRIHVRTVLSYIVGWMRVSRLTYQVPAWPRRLPVEDAPCHSVCQTMRWIQSA